MRSSAATALLRTAATSIPEKLTTQTALFEWTSTHRMLATRGSMATRSTDTTTRAVQSGTERHEDHQAGKAPQCGLPRRTNRRRERDVSRWLQIDVERTLTVDQGRDAILCDRSNAPKGETLIVKVTPEAEEALRRQLTRL